MAQLTEEDLKKMSPEELKELQKQNCVFCHIISGKIPAKKVYEDDKCIAILDIHPSAQGHVLLLPKEHYQVMPLVPDEEQKYLFMIAKQLSMAIKDGLGAEGLTIFCASGGVAGQKAPHAMIHLIPRKSGDGLDMFSLPANPIRPEDLDKIRLIIRRGMSELMGVEDKDVMEEIAKLEGKSEEKKEAPKEKLVPEKREEKSESETNLDKITDMFK